MYFKEVLKKCKDEGYPVSRNGLYYIGKKYGFMKTVEGERNLDFDKEKFLEWLKKAKEEIPEGWVTIKELHEKLNISLSQAYILSKLPEANAKNIGSGNGVVYVDPNRIREIIKQRENNYKWEE